MAGEVFNIGSQEEISVLDLARRVIDWAESTSEIRMVPYSEAYGEGFADMQRRVPDTTKIHRLLGWKPTLNLDVILQETIAEARAERPGSRPRGLAMGPSWLTALLVALVVTLVATPLMRRVALNVGLVDNPNARKVHKVPIPYLGGVAIALGVLLGLILAPGLEWRMAVVGVIALSLCGLGFLDDRRHLSPAPRIAVELTAAFATLALGLRLDVTGVGLIDAFLTLVWIVGLTNAANLLDNMDGLACGYGWLNRIRRPSPYRRREAGGDAGSGGRWGVSWLSCLQQATGQHLHGRRWKPLPRIHGGGHRLGGCRTARRTGVFPCPADVGGHPDRGHHNRCGRPAAPGDQPCTSREGSPVAQVGLAWPWAR